MRKTTLSIFFLPFIILSACSSDNTEVQSEKKAVSEEDAVNESTESTEIEDYSLSIPTTEDMEIVNEVTYAFSDESSEINWASYYAEIKNNSDMPINLSSSSVVYEDEAGEVVIMVSDMGLEVHPGIVNPGETAFVNVYDPIQDTEPFTGTYQANIEMQPIESIDTLVMHETEKVNVIFDDSGSFPMIRATGIVKTSKEVVGYDLAVILYDAEGNFLGALTGGSDDDFYSAGATTAFDIENPPFPGQLMSEVADWKAIAYSIQ
ncbi:hypothetical protein [Planococcus versutus]|uniref:DUF4352 domain-containing protein n=1 Tax=Planococcus versutus TaxID=1302659 RepID=A0A1B1S5F7_9BACL|nr:hypothetical protein [Planococcus versutus]ANU28413.1 hypothetical protein I858_015595 [Planococcus versutus]